MNQPDELVSSDDYLKLRILSVYWDNLDMSDQNLGNQ